MNMPIYYYALCKTTAPDESAFFFITRTQNPSFGSDGIPMTYMGTGEKLRAKVRQFGGLARFRCEVLRLEPQYDTVKRDLDRILNAATLADPKCLNMPLPEKNRLISEGLSGKPKSEPHKENIAYSMVNNDNALGHIKTEETRQAIGEAKTKLKWYHNKKTGEELQLEQDEEPITGFELGRLPKELHSKFKKLSKRELTDAERAVMIKD